MKFFEQLKSIDLILASQSPRRKELLKDAGFPFRVWSIPCHEEFPEDLLPHEIALFLCKQKAEPFKSQISEKSIVITADTIVVKDKQILNKAGNAIQAGQMLTLLSGTTHQVITGVCITSTKKQVAFYETTLVKFAPLLPEEIDFYINTYKPFDKAGAYGIQEWIGLTGVERIEGSWHNVVGLPVAALYRNLKDFIKDHIPLDNPGQ
ncbi:MAG: Maf family nucleotide pyrophosphatase [Bacteroidales bacterium]|nr:Maf family nucleotide pyrophosphatase [Bacteroidales bacterium]